MRFRYFIITSPQYEATRGLNVIRLIAERWFRTVTIQPCHSIIVSSSAITYQSFAAPSLLLIRPSFSSVKSLSQSFVYIVMSNADPHAKISAFIGQNYWPFQAIEILFKKFGCNRAWKLDTNLSKEICTNVTKYIIQRPLRILSVCSTFPFKSLSFFSE